MPGLSIHVIDASRGIPATGMRVELRTLDAAATVMGDALVGSGGAVPLPDLATRPLPTGVYEAVFHVADWYRAQGVAMPDPGFLGTVPFRFGIADPAQHYHLPLKVTPWGFSLFRGGA
jgi:5-hydroxyisourate hydrolase